MKKHKFPSKFASKFGTAKAVLATLVSVSIVSSVIYFANNDSNIEKSVSHSDDKTITQNKDAKTSNHTFYVFYLPTCGYCHKAMGFIDANLKEKYKTVQFSYVDVSTPDGRKLYSKLRRELNIVSNGVPVAVIGNKYMAGFGENTGKEYIKNIEEILKK